MDRTQRIHEILDMVSESSGCSSFFKDIPVYEMYHVEVFGLNDHDGSSKQEFDVSYFTIDSASDNRLIQLLKSEMKG